MPIFSPSQGSSHPTRLLLNRHCPAGLSACQNYKKPAHFTPTSLFRLQSWESKGYFNFNSFANRRKGIWPADFSAGPWVWSPVSAAARRRRPPVCHQGAQHPLSWHRHWKQAMQLAGPPRKSDFHSFHGFSLEPTHSQAASFILKPFLLPWCSQSPSISSQIWACYWTLVKFLKGLFRGTSPAQLLFLCKA